MAYTNSFLPKEAAYYTLRNATLSNGILTINAGGSIELPLTEKLLVNVTKTFSFNYQLNYPLDIYDKITLVFDFKLDDGKCQTLSVFPSSLDTNVHSIILSTLDGKLVEGTVSITSEVACQFNMWELCPEASNVEIQTIIKGVEQSLPKLLYDYNTWPLQVNEYERTISVITCRLLDNTDIQGHFSMTGMASESAILTLRFYDNEAEELFAPLEYDIKVGYNSIGVPHSYLTRLAGIHSFTVTAQVTTGTIDIDTRGILFTIDGGYLAAREITVGMDVCDLTIKQTSINSSPKEIWLIGIDAGEALIRKRSYSDQNTNVGFEPVSSLGKAKNGAIEFDGEWVYRPGESKYTIETDEWPWYFWTDKEDILWGQQGEDEKTRVKIATDVVLVKACKGFSSIDYLEQDQGLVVAYLKKDGTAWYRQRIRNPETKVKYWVVGEEQIGLETWSHISVTRLNDYRISFQLSNDIHNLWMYTDRTFVGQSVPPEIINLGGDDNKESFFYGEELPVVSILSIDEEEFEREYEDSEGNKKYAVLTLNLDQHLINRGEDLAKITSGEGSLRNNIEKVELNKKDDTKIEITTKKATVLHSSYGVIFNPSKAWFIVVKLEDGYSTFNRLYMYVDKKIEIDVGTEELILPTVENQVILRELGHFKGYENEVLNLNEVTNPVIYTEAVKKRTENKEELTLPTVSQTIIYLNSGGQPI